VTISTLETYSQALSAKDTHHNESITIRDLDFRAKLNQTLNLTIKKIETFFDLFLNVCQNLLILLKF